MCVVVTCYENGGTKSRAALRGQILHQTKENATENYAKLKWAYGEYAVSRAQVFRWHKAFLDGVRVWKTNLVLEELARQKRNKM